MVGGTGLEPVTSETEVGSLQINDMRAVPSIATTTCCHLISLDITQCHDRTVPKLSQRRLLTPEIDDIAAGAWRGCAFDQVELKALSQQPVGAPGSRMPAPHMRTLRFVIWAANSSAESSLRFSPLQVLTSVLSQYIDETQFGLA